MGVQEVVFAILGLSNNKKKALYEYYKTAGYKIKVYDYPAMHTARSKRYLREFDIEEFAVQRADCSK